MVVTREDGWDKDEELADWEAPSEADLEDGSVATCPACGEEVFPDVDMCPICGEFILEREASEWEGRPWWWIALAVLGMVTVIVVLSLS